MDDRLKEAFFAAFAEWAPGDDAGPLWAKFVALVPADEDEVEEAPKRRGRPRKVVAETDEA